MPETPQTPSLESIAARLQMPTAEQARQEAEAKLNPAAPPPESDPRMSETYTFTIDHKAGGNRRYQGTFKNKVLTIAERRLVGCMRARMAGGAPLESLTAEIFNQIFQVAWLQISLQERPDWFKDIDKLHDVSVLEAVFSEVASHEEFFFRPQESGGPGQETGRA